MKPDMLARFDTKSKLQ